MLSYEDITFAQEQDQVIIRFMDVYVAKLPRKRFDALGKWHIAEGELSVAGDEEKAYAQCDHIIADALADLTNTITKRKTTYIHAESGIPLIGSTLFGIVDRGSEFLEIKPLTGCNINCLFCSVDEGISSTRIHDFLIEPEYLVTETRKLISYKKKNHATLGEGDFPGITIFINPNGEPTLYPKLPDLIRGLSSIDGVKDITIITNATKLTPRKADELIAAGLTMMNVSLEAIDDKIAKKLAGTAIYDVRAVLEMLRHIKGRCKVVIAPVLIPSINLNELKRVVAFAKEIGAQIFIQNYMEHKRGRNKFDTISWEQFAQILKGWEEEFGISLWAKEQPIKHTIEYPKPFKRKETVPVRIVSASSFPKAMVGVSKDRSILIRGVDGNVGKTIKCEILHTKNNLFTARAI